jgi:hypothetical protein
MLAYSHIPKAGGTTLTYLLRAQYGMRHVDVEHRFPGNSIERHYRARDLHLDRKLHPGVRSLAGHWLKPWVDFGELSNSLEWYSFVRLPAARSFSQYVQDVQLGRIDRGATFADWAALDHLGGRNRNAQVKQIAGVESAEAAIRMVETQNIFVGLLEEYDLSLVAWRAFFDLEGFSLNYASARNVRSQSSLADELRQREPDLEHHLRAHNSEDDSFYQYIVERRFPEQLINLGGRDALESAPKGAPVAGNHPKLTLWNRAYRNLIYKPVCELDRRINPAS